MHVRFFCISIWQPINQTSLTRVLIPVKRGQYVPVSFKKIDIYHTKLRPNIKLFPINQPSMYFANIKHTKMFQVFSV